MAKPRYPRIAALLSGGSAFASRSLQQRNDDNEEHDDEQGQPQANQQRIQRGASIDQEALFDQMDTEAQAAADVATKAANTRWSEAFASDECKANPAAASRLLSTTSMSAADVIETVKDLGAPAGAGASNKPAGGEQQREQGRQENLERLAGNGNGTSPSTGSGASANGGEGQDGRTKVMEKHKATVAARNQQALARANRNKTAGA